MQITMQAPDQNMLIGYLPINQIMNLAKQAHFSAATAVFKPVYSTGSVDTEGDAVIKADQFRANTGLDGTGVTVGVLSNSVNQFAGGLADSVATGDLPPNVNVLQDDPFPGNDDEGRAMLEIVHDIAPGSGLAFHTADGSENNFAQGILDLKNKAGAKVIVDDVGYADEPMFNDGIIADSVNQVAAAGVFYASAAGNFASQGWTDAWRPVNLVVAGKSGTFENFSTIPGAVDPIQTFGLLPGEFINLSFQWDSAFLEGGSPLPNFQVPNDMGAIVIDLASGAIVATFDSNNKNTDMAWEQISFLNLSVDSAFGLAFYQNNPTGDPAPTTLRWVNFGGFDPQATGEGAATSFGHTVAQGAVAVGAVPWFDPTTPEDFTKIGGLGGTAQGGPVQINFDAAGNRLPTPQIRDDKPEVVAPDGVSTTFFGDPFAPTGQAHAFFGTSAAAPHVAGEAALYFQQVPSAIPDDILLHMEDTAVPIPINGQTPNNITGFGLTVMSNMSATNTSPEGDRFEFNETSASATQMGAMVLGRNLMEALSIQDHLDGLPDYDWYQWTTSSAGTVTASVHLGNTAGPLEVHLFTIDSNGSLIQLSEDQTPIGGFLTVSANVAANEPILVEVKGLEVAPGVWGQGRYSLDVTLA
jgi:hypothetical protein